MIRAFKIKVAVLCALPFLLVGCGTVQEDARDMSRLVEGAETEEQSFENEGRVTNENETEYENGATHGEEAKYEVDVIHENEEMYEDEAVNENEEVVRETVAEEMIRTLLEEELTLIQEARFLVYNRICSTECVTVAEKEKYDFAGFIIDEVTGNSIVSEAVKTAIKGTVEGWTKEEILKESLRDGVSEIPGYLRSEAEGVVKDSVTDIIGPDIWVVSDFLDRWRNADAVPTVLVNKIAEDQEKDLKRLDAFLQQEKIGAVDVLAVAQIIYAIDNRAVEVETSLNGRGMRYLKDVDRLQEIGDRLAELSGELDRATMQETERIIDVVDEVALKKLKVGYFASNYDLEGFVDCQRNASRQGVIGSVFGDWFGGVISDNTQKLEDDIQNDRASLSRTMVDNMESSFLDMSAKRVDYLEALARGDANGIEEATERYVAEIEKYAFDLEVTLVLNKTILSSCQDEYLKRMEDERTTICQCIKELDPDWSMGYSMEEKANRYESQIQLYIDAVDYVQLRAGSQGLTPGFKAGREKKEYGLGNYVSYVNGNNVIMIVLLGTGQTLYSGAGEHFYYDLEGEPLYIRYGSDSISLFEGEVMDYNLGNENNLSYYIEAARKAYAKFKL